MTRNCMFDVLHFFFQKGHLMESCVVLMYGVKILDLLNDN